MFWKGFFMIKQCWKSCYSERSEAICQIDKMVYIVIANVVKQSVGLMQ